MNCSFSRNNYKNTLSLNQITIELRWDRPGKTIYMEESHPTSVRSHPPFEVRSHLSEIKSFSYKRFVFINQVKFGILLESHSGGMLHLMETAS